MPNCRNPKCQKPVVWGTSPNAKAMPYDPNPVAPEKADGFKVLYRLAEDSHRGRLIDGAPNDMVAVRPAEYATVGEPLFSSHFQTCAYAGEFSRR